MSIPEQIDSAVIAHSEWKVRLRQAVETVESEHSPADVSVDNKCAFGKWLHEEMDTADRTSSHYREVVQLHADFHKEAGSILKQALQGDSEQAQERLGLMSEFSSVSSKLISSLKKWKDSIN